MKPAYLFLSLGLLSGCWTTAADAGSYRGRRIIPGVGEGSSVDTYLPNPDPQPPVVWSQGTEPPPPQADLGGGFLQYLVTGTERRPVPPRVYQRPMPPGYGQAGFGQGPIAYAPAAAAPVQVAIDPMYRRQEVAYAGPQAPGTIVVDTGNKFLYLVGASGRALRYGIGVGRPGFLWSGTKIITRKAEWPDWTPPSEMMARRPDLPVHMAGGIGNPLGARAMYLGSSLFRIHGTNEPDTIGTNVSSGCIRLLNEDVADLYARVRVGTRVIVI